MTGSVLNKVWAPIWTSKALLSEQWLFGVDYTWDQKFPKISASKLLFFGITFINNHNQHSLLPPVIYENNHKGLQYRYCLLPRCKGTKLWQQLCLAGSVPSISPNVKRKGLSWSFPAHPCAQVPPLVIEERVFECCTWHWKS